MMETTLTLDTTPKTDAEYEAAIDKMMMQMEQMQVEIAESHRLTDQLQIRTREKLDHFEKILAQIEAS